MVDNIPGGLNFSLQENTLIRSNQRKIIRTIQKRCTRIPYSILGN